MKIIIACSNPILTAKLRPLFASEDFVFAQSKSEFSGLDLHDINPTYIFFPHWSFIIPSNVYENFICVVFHMTDLPYGRGGSPLQNLIQRKIYETKISALKVVKELDAGPIYIKKPLSLYGTAEEIYLRASDCIASMIAHILKENLIPKKQEGDPVVFKRRTPEMSCVDEVDNIEDLFDHIRMLDADGYPKAFLENEDFRFEFTRASLKSDGTIKADVRIFKK